jgi:hypothetical protein
MDENIPEPEPDVEVEESPNQLLKPKRVRKPVEITEEERKIRSERMKVVNAARIAKAQETKAVLLELAEKKQAEKLQKIKEKKEQIGAKIVAQPKQEIVNQPPAKVEKKEKKKIIKIVNQAESEDETDSESDDEIVIVNTRQKSKSKPKPVQAQPKPPVKPDVICKFV